MRVGIVGDTHEPFCLDGYREWCKEVFDQWECEAIYHIGDLVDNHDLSFHDSEPTAMGAFQEHLLAKEAVGKWAETFPNLTWFLGNHDILPQRQIRKVRMDADTHLKTLHELYDLPKTWKIVPEELVTDGVIYRHAPRCGGVHAHGNDAKNCMQSTVTGHLHGNLGISYHASEHRAVFGMAVGCGVDVSSYAMAYGKPYARKPIVGCGVVINGHPYIERMDLGEKP